MRSKKSYWAKAIEWNGVDRDFEVWDYCGPIHQADPGAGIDPCHLAKCRVLDITWDMIFQAWPGVGAQEAASRRAAVQGRRPREMRDVTATEPGVALKRARI